MQQKYKVLIELFEIKDFLVLQEMFIKRNLFYIKIYIHM